MSRGAYALVGAKGKLHEQLSYQDCIALCPVTCNRFVEPCVGAGNITSWAIGHYDEVQISDLDRRNINIYFGLRKNYSKVLNRAVELEQELCSKKDDNYELKKFWGTIGNRAAAKGLGKPGDFYIEACACALVYKNYSYNGTNSKNKSYAVYSTSKIRSGDIVRKRMLQLEIFNNPKIKMGVKDVLKVLDMELEHKEQMEHTFYFIDPPYLGADVGYPDSVRCTAEDFHRQLCQRVRQLKNVMICGFESDLYTEELEAHGFYKTLICEKYVSASSQKGERRKVKEFIWTSYPV